MHVELVDPDLVGLYGSSVATERYYCRFGLNPAHRPAIEAAGLKVAGVDASDGDVRVLRLDGHPFYVLTLFVPQTSSAPGAPHPLVLAFVRAAFNAHAPAGRARPNGLAPRLTAPR
jgi:CTP synthase (UTP-ammonia lyase)